MGTRDDLKHTRPPGRPMKLLDETVQATLLEALKVGAPISLACEAASIAQSTFYLWMQRGHSEHVERSLDDGEADEDETPYLELYEAVQKARASAALRNVGVIQRVANGGTVLEKTTEIDRDGTERVIEKRQAPDWRAAAWWLERSYRGDFRKEAEQVEISGPGGGPVQIGDAEDLSRRLAEHLEAGAVSPKAIEAGHGEDPAHVDTGEDYEDEEPQEADVVGELADAPDDPR